MNSTREDPLFESLQLGSLALPNRVVMTTVKVGYGTARGEITKRCVAFYALRAQGGAGLITTEPVYIQTNGRQIPTQLGVHEERLVDGLRGLVETIHASGGRVMVHIIHAGRAANPKWVPPGDLVSASAAPCKPNGVTPVR